MQDLIKSPLFFAREQVNQLGEGKPGRLVRHSENVKSTDGFETRPTSSGEACVVIVFQSRRPRQIDLLRGYAAETYLLSRQ